VIGAGNGATVVLGAGGDTAGGGAGCGDEAGCDGSGVDGRWDGLEKKLVGGGVFSSAITTSRAIRLPRV